jgi:biotin carboxylase
MISRLEPLTVVAPTSVQSWYGAFARESSPVIFVGEKELDCEAVLLRIAEVAESRPIRILSGHDSLIRDFVVGRRLRAIGVEAITQSGFASAVGIDKLLQKRMLAAAGIPVPVWGGPGDPMPPDTRILCKERDSTQSRGLRWADRMAERADHVYWEEFVPGVEYSVVLYRDGRTTTVFPVVWKGEDRLDLLPPWRRLRTVPSGLDPGTTESLIDTTVKIAEVFDTWGFIEVEFIVPWNGEPLVIDVNPRICGTLRLVAMATGVRVFDWTDFPGDQDRVLPVRRYAAEIPFDGPPFVSESVIATSRLTCSGDDSSAVRRMLTKWVDGAYVIEPNKWPAGWCAD